MILKGYVVKKNNFNGKVYRNLELFFDGDSFTQNESVERCEGVPSFKCIYKGHIDTILPTLVINADYNVFYYYDKETKRYICNGLIIK